MWLLILCSLYFYDNGYAIRFKHFENKGKHNRVARFRGGTPTPANDDHAYTVAIITLDSDGQDYKFCSGALLTRSMAITSASCVIDATFINVFAGDADLEDNTVTPIISSASALFHPKFIYNKHENDIALLQLNNPFTLSNSIKTISLLEQKSKERRSSLEGKHVTVVGYGGYSEGQTELIRNKVDLTVMPQKSCVYVMQNLHYEIVPSLSCFSNTEGTPCAADRGGPVIDGGFIVGVVTDVIKCSNPSVFTRIGPYLTWIRLVIPEI